MISNSIRSSQLPARSPRIPAARPRLFINRLLGCEVTQSGRPHHTCAVRAVTPTTAFGSTVAQAWYPRGCVIIPWPLDSQPAALQARTHNHLCFARDILPHADPDSPPDPLVLFVFSGVARVPRWLGEISDGLKCWLILRLMELYGEAEGSVTGVPACPKGGSMTSAHFPHRMIGNSISAPIDVAAYSV
ncbi:hypothetical protein FKP32DRAFT_1411531 [Trametes sanguinea]|nr:hypothetical protein FKP32DRAFT_1411531 [Trametes sanguinea]